MTDGIVVPGYVHPLVDPAFWSAAKALGRCWACVVVNVADGPGTGRVDDEYVEVLARLHEAGVRTAGYVDLDYGRRRSRQVRGDVARWRKSYRVDGVFFDRFPPVTSRRSARLLRWARTSGASLVVVNPGTHPEPAALTGVDVCVSFEGDADAHERLEVPLWARQCRRSRLVHLVYGAPPERHLTLQEHAAALGAAAYVTERALPNPWHGLPSSVLSSSTPFCT